MVQWLRRNAEAQANMFVINASTPAQVCMHRTRLHDRS